MKMPRPIALTAISILLPLSRALDVEIRDVICNDTLPINVTNFQLTCNGESRCTFGETATVYGEMKFTGVEDSGVIDGIAYMKADLSFVSLDYHLFDELPVNLCKEGLVVADENNDEYGDCPDDGYYTFQTDYSLPSYDEQTSWLATGWPSQGEVFIKPTEDTADLIGHCTFKMKSMVTPSTVRGVNPPSAATTAGIILGAIGLALLLCCYCTCRSYCKKSEDTSDAETSASDFKRMDDAATEVSKLDDDTEASSKADV